MIAKDATAMTMPAERLLTLTEQTFEDFFEGEYPCLVAVATALAGVHNAEDLVQDTMVKALLRWNRVRQLERPGGWAHRVLINACRGWWRRQRIEAKYLASLRRIEPLTDEPLPEALAFWDVVRRLPTRPRAVMVLHYAGDRPTEEIASILDIPEGTVRSDLTRARAALARMLEA